MKKHNLKSMKASTSLIRSKKLTEKIENKARVFHFSFFDGRYKFKLIAHIASSSCFSFPFCVGTNGEDEQKSHSLQTRLSSINFECVFYCLYFSKSA